jgi:hypothetical protein
VTGVFEDGLLAGTNGAARHEDELLGERWDIRLRVERPGFISPRHIDVEEKEGRGWMCVLVLKGLQENAPGLTDVA